MSKACTMYVYIFLLCSTQLVLCMDDPNAKKPETPQIYPQLPPRSAKLSPTHSMGLNDSANSSWYGSNSYSLSFNPVSAVAGLVSSAANIVSSVATTVYNEVSEEAPFQKIGFPLTDSYAFDELTKDKALYQNVLKTSDTALLREYLDRIYRRTNYLTRAFFLLPKRNDFGAIVLHCKEHHTPAMSPLLHECYDQYFKKKRVEYDELEEKRKKLNVLQDGNQIDSLLPLETVNDTHSFSITIPTLNGIVDCLWSNANSLYETGKNEWCDWSAFQKLGWPLNDSVARGYLADTLKEYKRVLEPASQEDICKGLPFVLRRTKYLVRAFFVALSFPDGYKLANHLVVYHKPAMFPLLLELFNRLIANQREDLRLKEEAMLKKSDVIAIDHKINFNFGKLTNKNAEEIKQSPETVDCFLLKQKHETTGFVVNQETRNIEKLSQLGDFLVTNIPKIKLSVLTADCLPILFNDTKNKAVGIAHAGWRGSVAGISKAVLESMQRHYQTKPENVSIIFGPCIHACCYKVGQELISRVNAHSFGEKTIIKRGEDHFFDLLAFNKALLVSLGVREAAIDSSNSVCTSCNTQYHSHRREGELAGRQLSTVWIE